LFLLLLKALLKLGLLLLHLLNLGLVLSLEIFSKLFDLLTLLLTKLVIESRHEGIRQVVLEDLLLLLNLTLLELLNHAYFTILASLLHVLSDRSLSLLVLVFKFLDLLLHLDLNFLLLSLKLFNLSIINSAGDQGVNSLYSILALLSDFLLLANLLFHHGQDFFLKLHGLLLVEFEE